MFYIVTLNEDIVTSVKSCMSLDQAVAVAAEMVEESGNAPMSQSQVISDFMSGHNFFGNCK